MLNGFSETTGTDTVSVLIKMLLRIFGRLSSLSVCCAEEEEIDPKQAQIEAKSNFLIMGYWFKFLLTMVRIPDKPLYRFPHLATKVT